VLEGYGDPARIGGFDTEEFFAGIVATWGTGEMQHVINPDMPWRGDSGGVGPARPPSCEPEDRCAPTAVDVRIGRAGGASDNPRANLGVHHADDPILLPARGTYIADHVPGAKYVELPGRNVYHFVEPGWRASFHEIREFLTGQQGEVADDRVLATVLFTNIVDSTRRAAQICDC